MQLDGSVAIVTGANRGLGRHIARQLVARGAKVYAGARNPSTVDIPGVIPVQLDVTDAASVAAAAALAQDATLVVNNAGIFTGTSLLTGSIDDVHLEMDTHFYGALNVTRAFAPVLAANGGGGVLNVLSVLSWISFPDSGAYCAAKSAEWSLSNALRVELAEQGTTLTALHVGYMDTDMAAGVEAPKSDPADVAKQALDAVEAGEYEVLADDISRTVKSALSADLAALYGQLKTPSLTK